MNKKVYNTIKDIDRDMILTVRNIHIDPLIKLRKYSDAFTGVGPSVGANGRPVTGLTEASRSNGKITSQGTRVEMEKLLGYETDMLKSTSKFWDSYAVNIHGEGIKLDLADDFDLLKFLFLSAQSHVCLGTSDIYSNSKHEFVMFSDEQVAKEKVESRSSLKLAYKLSEELDLETKINILAVYGVIADATKPNTINNAIDDKLEDNPERFLGIANDPSLVAKSLITKCMSQGILIQKDGSIMHGDVVLGFDIESATAAIIKEPKLSDILRAKLSGDRKALAEAIK